MLLWKQDIGRLELTPRSVLAPGGNITPEVTESSTYKCIKRGTSDSGVVPSRNGKMVESWKIFLKLTLVGQLYAAESLTLPEELLDSYVHKKQQ